MQATSATGKLRGYQNLILRSINEALLRDERSLLIVAPTGSGKTLTFTALVEEFLAKTPSLRVLFMINRVQLVKQLERVLQAHGLDVGVCCGSLGRRELSRQLTIASYLSIIHVRPAVPYNLVIWDEAHTFAPQLDDPASTIGEWYEHLRSINPRVRDIGFTATPYTTTAKIYGSSRHFSRITYEVYMKDLLTQRYLVPARSVAGSEAARFDTKSLATSQGDYLLQELEHLAADDKKLHLQVLDALTHLNRHARRSAVWQCVSIDHCERVARMLSSCGEMVAICHSEMDYSRELEEFEAGKRRHLVFVTIVAVGYDHPPIDAIVILRPTKSPVLMVQSVGRVLRPSPSKEYALVLDYGNVITSCGPIDYPFIRQRDDIITARKTNPDHSVEMEAVTECSKCGEFFFGTITPSTVCAGCLAPLHEQQVLRERQSAVESLASKAASLEGMYSRVEAVAITHTAMKWKLDMEKLSHHVLFTYNHSITEELTVPPFTRGRSDKRRMGAYRRLYKRMKDMGCQGEDLTRMALSQDFRFMPKAVLVADGKVIEVSGLQPIQHDADYAPEQALLDLRGDSRGEGSR